MDISSMLNAEGSNMDISSMPNAGGSNMDISSMLNARGIQFKTCLDPDWDLYCLTYNSRVPAVPQIVILPATIEQVSQAVCCAAACGLKVQARSGGHSYASHSHGGVDGAAVIDLRKFQDIRLNKDNIALVGGGVRLGSLATAIFAGGQAAIAHGTCPTVGIGGHFTHGGFGYLSRAWGLAMDHIVGLDVVLADGKIVQATKDRNKQIFLVMRGAANSFGIIVNFYLRTQPAPEAVVKWSINAPEAMNSIKNATEAFRRVQTFTDHGPGVDRTFGLVVFLQHNRFTLNGTYLGSIDEFRSTILPGLMCCFQHKKEIAVKFGQLNWPRLVREVAGGMKLEPSPCNPKRQCFFANSAAVARPGLSPSAVKRYFKYLLSNGAQAPIDYFISFQLYGGYDSQITVRSISDDSFGHRDAMWIVQHHGSINDSSGRTDFPEEGIGFLKGLNKALGSRHGASSNYADPTLKREEALRLYYGGKLEELVRLKGEMDPNDVFSHPQSIPPKF